MSRKWDEFFMRQVYLVASMSKDPSTKIGAVLVRDKRVIAQGFNGQPQGCDDKAKDRYEKPKKYLYFEHGERNAIFSCARHGISAAGATLYTQGVPCADCGRAVIQAGVKEVVVHGPWMAPQEAGTFSARWAESCEATRRMFHESGVTVRTLPIRLGVEGFVDHVTLEV